MSLEAATDHSLAGLLMIEAALARKHARAALSQAQMTAAAIGGTFGDDRSKSNFRRLIDQLAKRANGD